MDGDFQIVNDADGEPVQRRPVGRPKGRLNRSTVFMRDLARRLVENNEQEIENWIADLATGRPAVIVQPSETSPGGVIPGTEPNIKAALEIILKFAEFGYAKSSSAPGSLPPQGDPDDNDGDDATPMLPGFYVTVEGE